MPAAPRDNARGILAMNAASVAFIVGDSIVKAVSTAMPLGQIMVLRGAVASALLVALCLWTGAFAAWRTLFHPTLGYRLVGEIGATLLYVTALMYMPLGNATAIFQVTPLAITAAAALFLGETVGWRRWTAILVGFGGVLIIIRPGFAGFDRSAFLVLGAVFFVVLRDLATSQMPAGVPTPLAVLNTASAVMVTGFVLIPFEGIFSRYTEWQPVSDRHAGLLALAGCVLVLGYMLLTFAMRVGDMSVVAPFRYALLIWSFLAGLIFFGDVPDRWTLLGAAIVVMTGIYSFQRERLRARAQRAAASGPVP
ncbi:DMT family transporter [Prosthecodimorpha staleyi]|uniref:DMT family transporter n=1 Tax=Prosthecodimorpha staleyi TaxID=2840188 RepID=A0A947DAW8_9HYPH|nr:DMT family transporter [Prosthecodimorpha staleyi]MBT9290519.1 DMT family transporter [Prosthecodimorpha staleyi]